MAQNTYQGVPPRRLVKGKWFAAQILMVAIFVVVGFLVWFNSYQPFRQNSWVEGDQKIQESTEADVVVEEVESITTAAQETTTTATTIPPSPTSTTKKVVSLEQPRVPPPSAHDSPPSLRQYAIFNMRPSNDNIFFVETSCVFNHWKNSSGEEGGLVLNPRQTCSVYAAAVVHPERPVYLYHTCPIVDDFYSRSSKVVKRLLELPNVGIVRISPHPEEWFKGTPIEGLATNMSKSQFPVEHASDALRMLLLWKYGGTYLDLDVIALKNLTQLGKNWAGAEDKRIINNGIIDFGKDGPGHRIVEAILNMMKGHYHHDHWADIGPILVSDVIVQECNIRPEESFNKVGRMPCGFTIHPTETLFPLHYSRYPDMFKPDAWDSVAEVLGRAYTTHAWNKLSSGDKAPPGCPYVRLAQTYCPLVYEASEGNF